LITNNICLDSKLSINISIFSLKTSGFLQGKPILYVLNVLKQ
jgi:hypothetical protein